MITFVVGYLLSMKGAPPNPASLHGLVYRFEGVESAKRVDAPKLI
jgi:hypothetical protein